MFSLENVCDVPVILETPEPGPVATNQFLPRDDLVPALTDLLQTVGVLPGIRLNLIPPANSVIAIMASESVRYQCVRGLPGSQSGCDRIRPG